MTSIRDAASAWSKFWFDPADPYTLGIIRLLTGWMLVYNLLVWGIDLKAFFGPDGLQPLQTIIDFHADTPVFSFWFYVPEPWIETVHWLCVGIAFLFFLGVGTRVTSVLAFLITISYSQRVPVANFGLDQILGMLCLYLAIGPSGACLSLDRWWKVRRARLKAVELPEPRCSSARLAVRLIQFHMCVIYFWAGLGKLKGDSWFTGEAMWQVLANQEYQTMDLTWMAWTPFLPYLVAHVTVIWEMSFCILVWNKKLRPWVLLIGTGMHFGIGAFLGMWTFGLVMTYAYFAFSDSAAWRRRLGWLAERLAATIPRTPSTQSVPTEPQPQPEPVPSTSPVAVTLSDAPPIAEPAFANDSEPDWGFDFPIQNAAREQPLVEEACQEKANETVAPHESDTDRTVAGEQTGVNAAVVRNELASTEVADMETVAESTEQPATAETAETAEAQQRAPRMNRPVIRPTAAAGYVSVKSSDAARQETTPQVASVHEARQQDSGEFNLNPETALLLITLCKNERSTLRRYFGKHDITCKAAPTIEIALSLTTTIKPVAVVVAGTQMQSEELATLLEDLQDLTDAPTLALTSKPQAARLAQLGLPTRTLIYPVSPGEIRRTLGSMLFGPKETTSGPNRKRKTTEL